MKLRYEKLDLLLFAIFLCGSCIAGSVQRTSATTSEGHQHPQTPQLELLFLGHEQLVSDLSKSAEHLIKQDSLVALEMDRQRTALEEIRRRGREVGRANARVRPDLQLLTARGEKLQMAAWRLRDELGSLQTVQDRAAQRIKKALAVVLLLSGTASQTHSPVNMTQLKETLDSQSRRLSDLSTELTWQDELMMEHQNNIADLEHQETYIHATPAENKPKCLTRGLSTKRHRVE